MKEQLIDRLEEFWVQENGVPKQYMLDRFQATEIAEHLLESIRTALQDERGRAREAAIEEVARHLQSKYAKRKDLVDFADGDKIANMVRTLKSQSPPGEAQGWRTIDDDARSGDEILAFFPDWNTWLSTIFADGRWWILTGIDGRMAMRGQPQPTHWQPLPAPPLPTMEG